ncbi:MmcQ/YjbR family DNA-binding protein [Archangium lipolyticum]|uniref:MmcQ/YjbR family DNA-binding protein n=1 Tax=Archangium lipolyticum TaxID=2970465 RepID=UPI002149D574|nr:MmcQ/YjbR family DNA-binding protein [Archangium lipolyticum]
MLDAVSTNPKPLSGWDARVGAGRLAAVLSPNDVRKLALSLPETEEQDHFGKPSLRVRGKIFATLWVKEKRAVLKLSLEEQDAFVRMQPDIFAVTPWGHQGWTSVELERVDRALFEKLLVEAWRRIAPKRVVAAWDTARGGGDARPSAPSRPRRPVRAK